VNCDENNIPLPCCYDGSSYILSARTGFRFRRFSPPASPGSRHLSLACARFALSGRHSMFVIESARTGSLRFAAARREASARTALSAPILSPRVRPCRTRYIRLVWLIFRASRPSSAFVGRKILRDSPDVDRATREDDKLSILSRSPICCDALTKTRWIRVAKACFSSRDL
jgi:hypothetical protein